MLTGALLVEEASQRAAGADAKKLAAWAKTLNDKNRGLAAKLADALSDELAALMENYPDRKFATTYDKELTRRG